VLPFVFLRYFFPCSLSTPPPFTPQCSPQLVCEGVNLFSSPCPLDTKPPSTVCFHAGSFFSDSRLSVPPSLIPNVHGCSVGLRPNVFPCSRLPYVSPPLSFFDSTRFLFKDPPGSVPGMSSRSQNDFNPSLCDIGPFVRSMPTPTLIAPMITSFFKARVNGFPCRRLILSHFSCAPNLYSPLPNYSQLLCPLKESFFPSCLLPLSLSENRCLFTSF